MVCTVRHKGKSLRGKALLESSEVLLRGDVPLNIPFSSITGLNVVDGELHVRTKDGLTVFVLGDKAAKWHDRIASPKTLVEKLGPKAGESVAVIGSFEPEFLAQLERSGAKTDTKVSPAVKWILLRVDTQADLGQIKACARAMRDSMALWLVYPKGQKRLTENDVRSAGLKAGLTDIKVAKFSETHTALKFVIPTAKRK